MNKETEQEYQRLVDRERQRGEVEARWQTADDIVKLRHGLSFLEKLYIELAGCVPISQIPKEVSHA